jgi:hypothetical protein
MKVGIFLTIDVLKLDKARFFKGEKGTYLDLTTFVDISDADKYGNNGLVTQSQTKEEREAKEKMPIIGNVKVFFKSGDNKQSSQTNQSGFGSFDERIPF